MASLPSSTVWQGPDRIGAPRRGARAWLHAVLRVRPARVTLLLGAVVMLNIFDLAFTIIADRLGCFIELNPVAAYVLGGNNYLGLVLYKLALVLIATVILWRHRHHRISELSCWLALFLYAGVAFRWHRYYDVFTRTYQATDAVAWVDD